MSGWGFDDEDVEGGEGGGRFLWATTVDDRTSEDDEGIGDDICDGAEDDTGDDGAGDDGTGDDGAGDDGTGDDGAGDDGTGDDGADEELTTDEAAPLSSSVAAMDEVSTPRDDEEEL